MNPRAVWSFIAGDSKLAPLCVGVAVIGAVLVMHQFPAARTVIGLPFVALIAAGLIASVFERIPAG